MGKYKNTYRIESNRLQNWNYASGGYYFITICTHLKQYFLGDISENQMQLSDIGKIAKQSWNEIPDHFPNATPDEFIVMPNHIHGIIILDEALPGGDVSECSDNAGHRDIAGLNRDAAGRSRDTKFCVSTPERVNQFQHIIPKSLGSIVRGYKIGVTKWVRQNTQHYTIWQKNYHDRIIRNEKELIAIRQYIKYNPMNWNDDEYFM